MKGRNTKIIEYWRGNDKPFELNSDIDAITYIIQPNLQRYVDLSNQIFNIVKDLENLFFSCEPRGHPSRMSKKLLYFTIIVTFSTRVQTQKKLLELK